MHVEVHADRMVSIGVVAFGGENENASELWVFIECANTSDNVAVEDLKSLACYDDLPADETGTSGMKLVIDYCIEFSGVLEREAKKRYKLNVCSSSFDQVHTDVINRCITYLFDLE